MLAHRLFWERLEVEGLGQHLLARRVELLDFPSKRLDAANAAAVRTMQGMTAAEVLRDLARTRAALLDLVRRLPDDDLNTPGNDARTLLGVALTHDREHAAQIRAWRASGAAPAGPPPPGPRWTLTRIHHVALVVADADHALRFYRDVLGLPVAVDRVIEEQGVRGVLLPMSGGAGAAPCEIEIIQPVRDDTGVAKYLDAQGEGLHHVCLQSTDVAADLRAARDAGQRMIDETPRDGLAGRIGFLHPESNHGILVEFAQPPDGAPQRAVPAVGPVAPIGPRPPGRRRARPGRRQCGLPAAPLALGSTVGLRLRARCDSPP